MKLKTLAISAVVAGFLLGCGSGDTTDETTTETTETRSGTVADGVFKNATVFLDLNENGKFDSGEPNAYTDENGNFTLNYPSDLSGSLKATGGIDVVRNSNNFYLFQMPLDVSDNVNLTPFTTMAYIYSKNNSGVDYKEAVIKLANAFGVSEEDFVSNPENTPSITKLTTQIESVIEFMAKRYKDNGDDKPFYDIMNSFSKNIVENPTNDISDKVKEAFKSSLKSSSDADLADVIFDKVGEMNNNNDFSKYTDTMNDITKYIDENPDFTKEELLNQVNDWADYKSQFGLDYYQAKDSINLLSDYNDYLENEANNKIATDKDAKFMVSQIRETIYEILDPNQDEQEDNTTTIAGNIIDNYNSYLNPSLKAIDGNISATNTKIDESLKRFDKEFNTDFNYSFSEIGDRVDAISELFANYSEDENFTDQNTSFGDTISHTYSKDGDIVTNEYKLNDTNLTVTYDNSADSDDIVFQTNGALLLTDDENYSLQVTSFKFDEDGKLDIETNGTVTGTNDAKIDGIINIISDINKPDFMEARVFQSLNNLDIYIDADVVTSSNIKLKAKLNLKDTYFNLLAKDYVDGDLTLDGNITINTDQVWKQAKDDSETNDAYWDNMPISFIDDKLVYKYDVSSYDEDRDVYDINMTTINGDLVECNATTDWDNFDNLECKDDVKPMLYTYEDLKDKVVTFKVNNDKTLNSYDIWFEWNNDDSRVLNIDSGMYRLEGNGTDFVLDTDGSHIIDTVNEVEMSLSNPLKATDLMGDIKFIGNIKDSSLNTNAYLELNIQNNFNDKSVDYTVSNLKLTAPNLDVNLEKLKIKEYNEEQDKEDNTYFEAGDLNATVTDENGAEAKLENIYYRYSKNPTDDGEELYGKISYLDTTLRIYYTENGEIDTEAMESKMYLDINRTGYEPFSVTHIYSSDDNGIEKEEAVIKKGDYQIGYLNSEDEAGDNQNVTIFDSNGVKINYTKSNEEDLPNIILKDKDGNKLAEIDTEENNWEITYSDDSSETLY